ncbi:MAG TPA: hypothetical protein VGG19_14910 [Tepidisphaeraceae bacterium]|jgi:hypothetical protein
MKSKIKSDAIVTQEQIDYAGDYLRQHGPKQVSVELLTGEPELMVLMADSHARIAKSLKAAGLTDEKAWPILNRFALDVLKLVTVLRQSNRQLWNSLLPQKEEMEA